MPKRHGALDSRPLKLVGWACLALAVAGTVGYHLGWGPRALFNFGPAFLFALTAGALLRSWWVMAGVAVGAAIPWIVIDLDGDISFGGAIATLAGFGAIELMLIGIPLALGVGAARSRDRGRLESTDVMFPRVWAHLFDIWVLWVCFDSLFGADYGWLVAVIASFLYFGWLQGRTGWTLGKRIMRLRVVGPDGRVPGVKRAMKRYLTMLIEWTGVIGLIAALRSPTRQRFGDRWAGTHVVAVDRY